MKRLFFQGRCGTPHRAGPDAEQGGDLQPAPPGGGDGEEQAAVEEGRGEEEDEGEEEQVCEGEDGVVEEFKTRFS